MASSIALSLNNKVLAASNLSAVPNTQMDAVYERLRKHFSYFDPNKNFPIYLENAGASLCPNVVIDSMADYMRSMYVQIGAGYELSMRAKEVVDSAHKFMKTFVNGDEVGEVAFGSSSSQLLKTLSNCYLNVLKEGDEVIVHEANQEANAGPWVKLAEQRGLPLKFWKLNEDFSSSLESLGRLLSTKTRIVAVADAHIPIKHGLHLMSEWAGNMLGVKKEVAGAQGNRILGKESRPPKGPAINNFIWISNNHFIWVNF